MEQVFNVEYTEDGGSSSVEVLAASKYAAKKTIRRVNPRAVIKRITCGSSSDSPGPERCPRRVAEVIGSIGG